jgi:hypothetical protein
METWRTQWLLAAGNNYVRICEKIASVLGIILGAQNSIELAYSGRNEKKSY